MLMIYLFTFKNCVQESNRMDYHLQLQEKCKTIRLLTVCVEETQSQYNECFAEVC